jgi:hypothetical protein
MIEKEFIPYELALELKQLQFDETCFGWFRNTEFTISFNDLIRKERGEEIKIIAAPTYSQAFRWFREKHQLIHHMYWVYKKKYDGIDWIFHIKGINMINNNVVPHDETRFETYEEAELACLKKLIEIVKGGNK